MQVLLFHGFVHVSIHVFILCSRFLCSLWAPHPGTCMYTRPLPRFLFKEHPIVYYSSLSYSMCILFLCLGLSLAQDFGSFVFQTELTTYENTLLEQTNYILPTDAVLSSLSTADAGILTSTVTSSLDSFAISSSTPSVIVSILSTIPIASTIISTTLPTASTTTSTTASTIASTTTSATTSFSTIAVTTLSTIASIPSTTPTALTTVSTTSTSSSAFSVIKTTLSATTSIITAKAPRAPFINSTSVTTSLVNTTSSNDVSVGSTDTFIKSASTSAGASTSEPSSASTSINERTAGTTERTSATTSAGTAESTSTSESKSVPTSTNTPATTFVSSGTVAVTDSTSAITGASSATVYSTTDSITVIPSSLNAVTSPVSVSILPSSPCSQATEWSTNVVTQFSYTIKTEYSTITVRSYANSTGGTVCYNPTTIIDTVTTTAVQVVTSTNVVTVVDSATESSSKLWFANLGPAQLEIVETITNDSVLLLAEVSCALPVWPYYHEYLPEPLPSSTFSLPQQIVVTATNLLNAATTSDVTVITFNRETSGETVTITPGSKIPRSAGTGTTAPGTETSLPIYSTTNSLAPIVDDIDYILASADESVPSTGSTSTVDLVSNLAGSFITDIDTLGGVIISSAVAIVSSILAPFESVGIVTSPSTASAVTTGSTTGIPGLSFNSVSPAVVPSSIDNTQDYSSSILAPSPIAPVTAALSSPGNSPKTNSLVPTNIPIIFTSTTPTATSQLALESVPGLPDSSLLNSVVSDITSIFAQTSPPTNPVPTISASETNSGTINVIESAISNLLKPFTSIPTPNSVSTSLPILSGDFTLSNSNPLAIPTSRTVSTPSDFYTLSGATFDTFTFSNPDLFSLATDISPTDIVPAAATNLGPTKGEPTGNVTSIKPTSIETSIEPVSIEPAGEKSSIETSSGPQPTSAQPTTAISSFQPRNASISGYSCGQLGSDSDVIVCSRNAQNKLRVPSTKIQMSIYSIVILALVV